LGHPQVPSLIANLQLLELTRGSKLLLNPNSTGYILYPEEIAASLDQDEVPIVDQVENYESTPMEFREPDQFQLG